MWKLNVNREYFLFQRNLKSMENEDETGGFEILLMFKNLENEGEAERFQILWMLEKMWKIKVKREDFRFQQCSEKCGY